MCALALEIHNNNNDDSSSTTTAYQTKKATQRCIPQHMWPNEMQNKHQTQIPEHTYPILWNLLWSLLLLVCLLAYFSFIIIITSNVVSVDFSFYSFILVVSFIFALSFSFVWRVVRYTPNHIQQSVGRSVSRTVHTSMMIQCACVVCPIRRQRIGKWESLLQIGPHTYIAMHYQASIGFIPTIELTHSLNRTPFSLSLYHMAIISFWMCDKRLHTHTHTLTQLHLNFLLLLIFYSFRFFLFILRIFQHLGLPFICIIESDRIEQIDLTKILLLLGTQTCSEFFEFTEQQ